MGLTEFKFQSDRLSQIFQELYEDVKGRVSQPRFEHILSVTRFSASLAHGHGLSIDHAMICGILHDYAREMPVKEQFDCLDEEEIDEIMKSNQVLLHAKVAANIGKERYGLEQSEVEPVRWHTTGRAEMTDQDLVLFVADYFEPQRPWSTLKGRELAQSDLKTAAASAMQEKLRFTLGKRKGIHPHSIECWNWLCQYRNI